MSDTITFTIDGKTITGRPGMTILEAADQGGVYIPRLCKGPDLKPRGACRVCTVMVNGRPQSACTQPVAEGAVVENDTPQLKELRRSLIEMLFVEGNHFCPFCEKSGSCELQALAYRLGILAPRYPYAFPQREMDASHPDLMIDRNRCVLCGRCVNASRDVDGKTVFEFVGRGPHKRIAVNAEAGLGGTNAEGCDKAMEACPVGCILKKRVGYAVPIGRRQYDHRPIGSEIEVKP
ncbi:MAG: 2Fe-2S iron-sulfur cluster-binding protein [bacterium]|jgi:[NiFe] hydrogenase diaphorase moiety small subunit